MNPLSTVALIALCFETQAGAVTEVKNIEFKVQNGASTLEISGSGPIQYSEERNEQDRQLVLNLSDVQLSRNAKRRLDTSSFRSAISLVSPYVIEGQKNQARVVIQFREWKNASIEAQGNTIRVIADQVGSSQASTETEPTLPPSAASTESTPENANAEINLQKLEDARKSRNYVGSPITMQFRDADIRDVLRAIGDASGFNVIMSQSVTGTISLSLVDIPWDQALDVVLQTKKLAAERSGSILRVLPLDELTREKQDELVAKQASEKLAPKVTRVFSINFASPEDLVKILKDFGSASPLGGMSAGTSASGNVTIDKRTNSIIIQDTQENLDRMAKLIEILDTQTPQVLIEAKVVEATEGFTKGMSGQLGVAAGTSSSTPGTFGRFAGSFSGNNALTDLLGSTSTSLASAGSSSAAFAFQPNLSFLRGIDRINVALSVAESENKVSVVSSPRAVVLNQQSASITQTIPVATTTVTNTAAGPQTAASVTSAQIGLTVTPTVTNEESVLLDLSLSRDVPFALGELGSASAQRNIKTKVLVDNGVTLVLGGLYTTTTTSASGGFPILRKIPVLGWLFGSDSENRDKSEIFFFVTPKILNTKRAGLGNGGGSG
jgi:type IV pilus assembly protein PilQ